MRDFPWTSVLHEDIVDTEKIFSMPWQFSGLYWEVGLFTINYPAIWAASGRSGWPHKNISDELFESNHWLSDDLSPHLARDILISFDVGSNEHNIQTVSSPASGSNEFDASSFTRVQRPTRTIARRETRRSSPPRDFRKVLPSSRWSTLLAREHPPHA